MRAILLLNLSLTACLIGCADYRSVAVDDHEALWGIADDTSVCVELRSGQVLKIRDVASEPSVVTGVLERRGKLGFGTGICGRHGDIDWSDRQVDPGTRIEIPAEDVVSITHGGPSLTGAAIAFVVIAGVAVLIASTKKGDLGDVFDK